ncbi:MAG: c-type cytochrome [Planctomycetes bacterium]|nr:c-type cytochrome [Planctomycetota bacterium]
MKIGPGFDRGAGARCAAGALVIGLCGSLATADDSFPVVKRRPPWTASRITGTPERPLPYSVERVFTKLTFDQCVDAAHEPLSDRWFVVEQYGKIVSFPNRPDADRADLVIDFAKAIPGTKQVYALAFHPDVRGNRYCYVCYILADNLADGTHVSRFTLTDGDAPTIDPSSELPLITWLSGGHNGCCLKFGPDGCLYISTGDGVGPNPPDTLRTGQDVSDLLASILRIDVDRRDKDRNYTVPRDNPFVDTAGARPEIWAYGFRNPWRMSFDRATGDLWVGDVGWEIWELMYRVERGGNYGWSIMEGRQPNNPQWPRGPTPILPPTIDHPHSESSSITDGLTYAGSRIPELRDHHVYGDYDTGILWAFRYEDGRVVNHHRLADTTLRIVGFADDDRGEFVILDHTAGMLYRLVPNPKRESSGAFPRLLSETGLFQSVADQAPAPGVVPYRINVEGWFDHASSERWAALPGSESIRMVDGRRVYPIDSVLAKTLSLDVEVGNRASRRRIETRILHWDGEEWRTYSYGWNAEQTDAELVDARGDEKTIRVPDADAPGGSRSQTWRFPGRVECQRCHNKWSGPPLAFDPPQLHARDRDAPGTSQLETFVARGLFEAPPGDNGAVALVDPRDPRFDLDRRARSYLHVNCSHCHRMHAGSGVLAQMPFDVPLPKTDMVDIAPSKGAFGLPGAAIIAPGDPARSVLCYRMAKLGGGRMPHIGSTEVDTEGVRLIWDWILAMPDASQGRTDMTTRSRETRERVNSDLGALAAAGDGERAAPILDRLLASTTGALTVAMAVERRAISTALREAAIRKGAAHTEPAVRDLFEPYLPADQRVQRLGTAIRSDRILAMTGDASKGRRVFFETTGGQCANCHRVGNEGQDVGPDLSAIGGKLDRRQLLDSILEPSKAIDPAYLAYVAELSDGRIVTGRLVSKDEREVVLKTARNEELRFPSGQVDQITAQVQSLMPELLLRDLTAEQVADLLAFLGTLR